MSYSLGRFRRPFHRALAGLFVVGVIAKPGDSVCGVVHLAERRVVFAV